MGCTSSASNQEAIQPKSSASSTTSFSSSKLVLGYWAFPLRGQPIRYLLELAKFPYQETKYTPATATEWFAKDKQELGLDLPNLPYLIHGDFSITESQNIVNYILELTNQQYLLGTGDQKYKIDNIRFFGDELISKIFQSTRKSDEEKKTDLTTQIIPRIKQLQAVLGSKTLFFGKLTLADIFAYTAINNFKKTYPSEYSEFASSFDPFLSTFEAIPQVKSYQQSERFPK